MSNKSIYIAWIAFQRRQESFKSLFPLECFYFRVNRRNIFTKVFSYIFNFIETIHVVLRERPQTVLIQLPQTPALLAVQVAKFISRRSIYVVADCHNAMFRPPWLNYPLTIKLLSGADSVFVHNAGVLSTARRVLGENCAIHVVPDAPATFHNPAVVSAQELGTKPFKFTVLFPASWAPDEPILELVNAFNDIQEVRLLITGKPKMSVFEGHKIPPNVFFTGYLPREEFESILLQSDCLAALTKLENVQLSVCGEAIGAGIPFVCSDTELLRYMYSDCAVFSKNSSIELKRSINQLFSNYEECKKKTIAFRASNFESWKRNYLKFFLLPKDFQ